MQLWQTMLSLGIISVSFPIGYFTLKSVPEEKAGLKYFQTLGLLLFVGLIVTILYQGFNLALLAASLFFLAIYARHPTALIVAVYIGLVFGPAPSLAAFIFAFGYGLCSGAEECSLERPFHAWPSLALLAIGSLAALLA